MDFDEKKRRQTIRVVIAEVGMVLSVIAIVTVAILAAMGFMISSNGEIEQSGLMQLHTMPTGATVSIDGSVLFSRTNLSRTLAAGTHSIEISRDKYDSWQKDVNIYSGVLMRLYYPRLFLQERKVELVKTLSSGDLEFYAPSKGRNYILYAEQNSAEWRLLDIRGDEIKVTPLDLSGILPGMVEVSSRKANNDVLGLHNYRFDGEINKVIWNANDDKVLVKVFYDGKTEWVLVNLRNIAESLNITKTFGLGDVQLTMIDNAANQLYVLDGRQLKRINTADRVMSRVLLDNVMSFASYGTNAIYLSENEDGRHIGVYRDDEKGGTKIAEVPKDEKIQVALSNYYDEDYMVYTVGDKLNILYGKIPSYSEDEARVLELKELVKDEELAELPESLSVSPEGEFVVAQKAKQFMVTDLDRGDLYEYEAPSSALRWFDAGMMYEIGDGQILVWDFDGTNQRDLVKSSKKSEKKLETLSDSLVVTSNNRWIYYLSKDENSAIVLTREQIRE